MSWLKGKKTYLAAILAALVAANGVLHWLPDDYMQSLLALAAAFGLYGLRSAVADVQRKL